MSNERKEGPMEQVGEAVGGAVGKIAGRMNDMAMNAVGDVMQSALKQMGSWWSGPEAENASRSFGEREDRACRDHFESSRRDRTAPLAGYDRARSAYQFGHVAGSNPEYRSKPFDQVESELERAWETLGREGHGDWSEVRDQVGFAYSNRSARAPGAP